MKNKHLIMIYLAVIALLFSGCAEETGEDGMSTYEENTKYSYIKWEYNNVHRDLENRDNDAYWHDKNNLSSTAGREADYFGAFLKGHQLIRDYGEYSAFQALLEEKKNKCLSIVGVYYEPTEIINTYNGAFDETFFEEQNLLIVDYCASGSTNGDLKSRLDKITVEDTHVTVSVEIEHTAASTADCPGHIYFIPIPKECVDVDVTWIKHIHDITHYF